MIHGHHSSNYLIKSPEILYQITLINQSPEETDSDDGDKVTFPDFMLNPDSWEMGSRVVDAIIRDNTVTKVPALASLTLYFSLS